MRIFDLFPTTLFHSSVRKRQQRNFTGAVDFNSQIETLEVRAVPASSGIAPGTYHEPFPLNPPGDELVVRPDGTGEFYTDGVGRFAVKIKTQKNGTVVVKPDSKGIHGKIGMIPSDNGGYDYKFKLRGNGTVSLSGGTFLHT